MKKITIIVLVMLCAWVGYAYLSIKYDIYKEQLVAEAVEDNLREYRKNRGSDAAPKADAGYSREAERVRTISQCFFIYGAIAEAGRDMSNPKLFDYGKTRLTRVAGDMQANESNAAFKEIFEYDLTDNKKMGIQIRTSLKNAMMKNSKTQFVSSLYPAKLCDRKLGLQTNDMPSL